jgi:phospholipid/cholesterol/gamma-HCH transport system ATP-binding protein
VQIDCTILIVTHNINIARTVPDYMGMPFRRKLVMFGPREVPLTSNQPVVKQFLNGRPSVRSACPRRRMTRKWPRSRRWSRLGRTTAVSGKSTVCHRRFSPRRCLPDRKAVKRHRARVHEIMHTRRQALEAIRADLEGTSKYRGRDVA